MLVPKVKPLVTTEAILHEKGLCFAKSRLTIESKVRRTDTDACIVSSFVEKILRATSPTE